MPGPWTCVEEWMGIDLVAFSAWASAGNYARVGYEVKVSRSDLRRELLNPGKRMRAVRWCNEFYLAVPRGLLTASELAYREPDWEPGDFTRESCPAATEPLWPSRCRRGKVEAILIGPLERTRSSYRHHVVVKCPTCQGKGTIGASRVEKTAPTLWVPNDVGLVEVDGNGCHITRRAPRRQDVPALSPSTLGQLVRWVSLRPDPRHQPHLAAPNFD